MVPSTEFTNVELWGEKFYRREGSSDLRMLTSPLQATEHVYPPKHEGLSSLNSEPSVPPGEEEEESRG